MTEILDVLKRLHFPGLFIELMLLTYRFIFILMEGASAIMTAQKARLGNRDLKSFDPVFRADGIGCVCAGAEAVGCTVQCDGIQML